MSVREVPATEIIAAAELIANFGDQRKVAAMAAAHRPDKWDHCRGCKLPSGATGQPPWPCVFVTILEWAARVETLATRPRRR